jgi:hypothetical protein
VVNDDETWEELPEEIVEEMLEEILEDELVDNTVVEDESFELVAVDDILDEEEVGLGIHWAPQTSPLLTGFPKALFKKQVPPNPKLMKAT